LHRGFGSPFQRILIAHANWKDANVRAFVPFHYFPEKGAARLCLTGKVKVAPEINSIIFAYSFE
jgi:hypothetical protein